MPRWGGSWLRPQLETELRGLRGSEQAVLAFSNFVESDRIGLNGSFHCTKLQTACICVRADFPAQLGQPALIQKRRKAVSLRRVQTISRQWSSARRSLLQRDDPGIRHELAPVEIADHVVETFVAPEDEAGQFGEAALQFLQHVEAVARRV